MALLARAARLVGPRRRGGRILIQTFSPQHYAVAATRRHDYEAFYAEELVKDNPEDTKNMYAMANLYRPGAPTPSITPETTNDLTRPSGRLLSAQPPSHPKMASSHPTGTSL